MSCHPDPGSIPPPTERAPLADGPPIPRDAPAPSPEPAPPAARGPVPAAVSLALLAAAALGTAAWAVHASPAGPDAARAPARLEATTARDVLTGRPVGPDGVPLPPEEGPGSLRAPLRLRFVPSGDQQASEAAIDGLLSFVRRRTGYAIEGAILKSYGLVVQEIIEGRCEVAFLTAMSYARAHFATHDNGRDEDDITAILAVVRRATPEHPLADLTYRGALLVRRDSDLTDARQLTASRTVAMGNRTSGASSVMPSAFLNELGLAPRIQRFEGYPIIINAVLEGAVDAGCIWWMPPNEENPENDARILVKAAVPDVFERTRILAYTHWIPNEPVVARRAVPPRVRHVLARALSLYVTQRALTLEGRRELEAIGSLVGLIPAVDDDFRALIDVVERAFANDPEGLADFTREAR